MQGQRKAGRSGLCRFGICCFRARLSTPLFLDAWSGGSEGERLDGGALAARKGCLALERGMGIFGRGIHGMADLMHGLAQAADGVEG
jgi:hypothetical protein